MYPGTGVHLKSWGRGVFCEASINCLSQSFLSSLKDHYMVFYLKKTQDNSKPEKETLIKELYVMVFHAMEQSI